MKWNTCVEFMNLDLCRNHSQVTMAINANYWKLYQFSQRNKSALLVYLFEMSFIPTVCRQKYIVTLCSYDWAFNNAYIAFLFHQISSKSASLHAKASKTPQNVNILLITASPTFKRQTRLFDEWVRYSDLYCFDIIARTWWHFHLHLFRLHWNTKRFPSLAQLEAQLLKI